MRRHPVRRLAAALLAGSIGAGPARADLVAVGEELAIRDSATAPDPPSVCARPGGGFAVARAEGPTGASQVLAQKFDAQGLPVGDELAISGVGYMGQADIACASDGQLGVVWSSGEEQDDVIREDVYASVVDGDVIGEAVRINSDKTGRQHMPAVCSQGDGRFLVVWIDRSRDEIDSAVFLDDGEVRNRERVAGDPRAEVFPDVACADDGRALAVWGDFPSTGRNDEVAARALDSDGSPDDSRFYVNTYTTGDQSDAVVCAAGNDGFVVAWRNEVVSAGGTSIHARQLDAGGDPDGPSFVVSPLGRRSVAVTCGADRSFVAVTTVGAVGGAGVFAQRVESDGTLDGEELIAYPGNVSQRPRAAGNAGGTFVILWSTGPAPASVAVHGRFFQRDDLPTTTTTTTTLPAPAGDCGDADDNGSVTAGDALAILRGAVGSGACNACRCDADGSSSVTASDALRILSVAVGLERELACPPCAVSSVTRCRACAS